MPKLIMFDIDPRMCTAWRDELDRHPLVDVQVINAPLDVLLDEHEVDAVSSAGNPQGVLGSGIDGALRRQFPWLQEAVTGYVSQTWLGCAPVGSSKAVVGGADDPAVFYTPTMPNPGARMSRRLMESNVYMATRGLLISAETWMLGDQALAIPGMGTGVGGLPHNTAASAQLRAVREVRKALKA